MRVATLFVVLSLGLSVLSGCGEKEKESATEGMQQIANDGIEKATTEVEEAATQVKAEVKEATTELKEAADKATDAL
jgi:hypothetical protein